MQIADSNFLIPNATLIVELVAFLIVLGIVAKFVLPPLKKALDDRAALISSQMTAADEAKADATAADEERRTALEEARHQAREIVTQANRTAEQVRTEAQNNGQSEYERIVGNAETEVGLARQRAIDEAANRMGEIVMDVVERVIGREVNAEAHRDLIDEAVSALRADATGGAAASSGGALVNPTLQGYTSAILEAAGSGALAGLAGDLEAIDTLVQANPTLHSALTDTTMRGPVRRDVMLDLLDHKVSAPARRLAAFACSAVRATDVPAALAWVATRARHEAEGQAYAETPLSLLQSRQRVGGFATAVHEDLSTSELESLEDDLFRFARIVASTPALRSALVDRDLQVEARQGLVSQLLEGKVQPSTIALVRYAVAGGRARDIVGTLDWLVEETARARGWRIARVRSAEPIADDQRTSLSDSLSELAGAPVELQVVIDEALLSGAVIQVGDLQVDASARGRIDALREHLMPGGWEDSGFHTGAVRVGGTTTQTEGAG